MAQIKALLSLGHRFDVKNADTDETPFRFALEHGPAAKRLEMLSLSARHGVDVKGEKGAEALKYAVERWQDKSVRLVFMWALEGGADVNFRFVTCYGCTLMHFLARMGPSGPYEELLARGADLNAQDNRGWTPLIWVIEEAALSPGLEAAKVLLRFGADARIRDYEGRTALEHARKRNAEALIELFEGRR